MNVHQHDKVFYVTFAVVVGALGAFTLAIILISNLIAAEPPDETALARLEERIKPVGAVITDEKMLLAAAPPPAARAPMSGEEVVAKVCGACHTAGVLNAPKIGDAAAWAPLKAQGMNALVAGAVKGKNAMPPRGGDPSLSDAELKDAIQAMLEKSGG